MADDLVAKPGTKSVLWEHFGLRKGPDGKPIDVGMAIRRICYRPRSAKNGNMSNLLAHLRTSHSVVYAQVKEEMAVNTVRLTDCGSNTQQGQQLTISQAIDRVQKYERKGKKWKELTDSITYFIAKEMIPMYTVEKPGFRKMLASFDSKVPSRQGQRYLYCMIQLEIK